MDRGFHEIVCTGPFFSIDIMSTLEDAVTLAAHAHRGQRDKAGEPYLLHALRVMLRMDEDEARMAAVLHDVLEDTPTMADDLYAAGFSEAVVAAVEVLTRRSDESYDVYIRRVAAHPLTRRIKLADLEDNMDLRRLPRLTSADRRRLKRYRAAWEKLRGEP